MYVQRMCAWCPLRLEEGVGCPGIEVTDGCETPCTGWNQDQVLYKSNMCTKAPNHLSIPPESLLLLLLLLICLVVGIENRGLDMTWRQSPST